MAGISLQDEQPAPAFDGEPFVAENPAAIGEPMTNDIGIAAMSGSSPSRGPRA